MGKYRVTTDQGTFEVTTDDAPGTSAGAPASERFDPWHAPRPDDSFWHSLYMSPVHGIEDAIKGVSQLAKSGERQEGLHNILTGGSAAAAPFLLPEALAAAPGATLLRLLQAGIAAPTAHKIASIGGAPPETSNLLGDVAAIGAGGIDPRFARAGGSAAWNAPKGSRIINLIRGIGNEYNPPPEIPGLEGWEPFRPTKGAVPKFTPGAETPEISVSGRNRPTGWRPTPKLNEPVEPEIKPLSAAAKARMKFTPGSEVPEIGVTGRRALAPDLGTGPLVPPLASGLPEPAPGPFKPNPRVAKGMRFSHGSEIPEIGVGGRNPVRRTPFTPASAPAVDITTGEELVPAPKSPKTPKSGPIPPIEPKGSPVPANSASFRHPADFTDLIRQFHATHPKGTSLRTDAQNVFGTAPGTMPSYEQALKIHEWRLRNPGKSPTAADIK